MNLFENNNFVINNPNYSYESNNDFEIGTLSFFNEDYLNKLKNKYKLDKLVSLCNNDFDKVLEVTKWVSNLWHHDGLNQPEKNDPLFILDEVVENNKQFRCVEYGIVIYGCLTALGIPSRKLALKTADVESREYGAGHVVTEVYLFDLKKWIFVDGQFGVIPTYNNIPLNAVEFGAVLSADKNIFLNLRFIRLQNNNNFSAKKYLSFVKEYLYYLDFAYLAKPLDIDSIKRVMLTPTGSKNPTVFQIKYPLDIDFYTHSVIDFYPMINNQ
ncbi:MAG: transglutaminase-like domain-containing protein [Treponema sp.]|nr:transglutaminase-like domain-containing protein [Treponema sp.]